MTGRPTTINICEDHREGLSTPTQQISPAGFYALAISGTFDGATATVHARIGEAFAPIASFTEPAMVMQPLPICTLAVELTNAGEQTSISVGAAPTALRTKPTGFIPRSLWNKSVGNPRAIG